MEIELGSKVKCIHTGFTGTAMTKMEFFNKCVQYEVVPKIGKDNKMPDGIFIDVNSLVVIGKKKKPIKKKVDKEPTGGPMHKSVSIRGY